MRAAVAILGNPGAHIQAPAGDPRVYLGAILATLLVLLVMVSFHLLRELVLERRARRNRREFAVPADIDPPGVRVWRPEEWDSTRGARRVSSNTESEGAGEEL